MDGDKGSDEIGTYLEQYFRSVRRRVQSVHPLSE